MEPLSQAALVTQGLHGLVTQHDERPSPPTDSCHQQHTWSPAPPTTMELSLLLLAASGHISFWPELSREVTAGQVEVW